MMLRNNGTTLLLDTVQIMVRLRVQLDRNLVLKYQHRDSRSVCSVVYAVPVENAEVRPSHVLCPYGDRFK
jgi:hypothetical protein